MVVSIALISVLLVVLLRNNSIKYPIMFAVIGNRNALWVKTLSAFFVSRILFASRTIAFGLRVFALVVVGMIVGCSAEEKSVLNSDSLQPISQKTTSQQNSQSLKDHSLKPKPLNQCIPYGKTEVVRVSSVHDGDTLTLSDGRKVRLLGVNATEVAREGRPDEPFAKQAKQAAKKFLDKAKRTELLTDTEIKDHYGRWLGHIYNESGESLEEHLLKQGLGYHVAIPPNLSLAECLDQAEQQAQDNQLGLWGSKGISPVKAKLIKRGGFQRVRGRVTTASTGKHWRIELDNYLTVMLYSEHQHRFTQKWFERLQGKNVEIQGWVYKSRGEWRMKLETPYGIELL